jgi:hypothetical protein
MQAYHPIKAFYTNLYRDATTDCDWVVEGASYELQTDHISIDAPYGSHEVCFSADCDSDIVYRECTTLVVSPTTSGGPTIVVLGDSLVETSSMCADFTAALPRSKVLCYGISGATWEYYMTGQGVSLLVQDYEYVPIAADIVLWQLATNDFKFGANTDIDVALSWGHAAVDNWPDAIHGIAMMQAGDPAVTSLYPAFRDSQMIANEILMDQYATGSLSAELVPIHIGLDPIDGYSYNLYHPNTLGYSQITETWLNWIASVDVTADSWAMHPEYIRDDVWDTYGYTTLSQTDVLRVHIDAGTVAGATQWALTVGEDYEISGKVKSDGYAIPKVVNGSYLWTGTAISEWRVFAVQFKASDPMIHLWAAGYPGNYVDFKEISVHHQ